MTYQRFQLENHEKKTLAPYACKSRDSQGRLSPETSDKFRTCFQRDRARIIHTRAFRRLQGKTQVFVSNHGDHYRTRLTHTLEVTQISRDICKGLGLNEYLAESISLAHDLGHTPFGHAGERALHQKMQKFGKSFEHNQQSLRIVTKLEKRSPHYPGLNLSKEVIDGLKKHHYPYDLQKRGFTFLKTLEAQVVNIADEIAYLSHDLDDGLRSQILNINDLTQLKILQKQKKRIIKNPQAISGIIINAMITDIYQETQKKISKYQIKKYLDLQKCKKRIISFSPSFYQEKKELRDYLFKNLYKHPQVTAMNLRGQKIITKLFDFFYKNPKKIPSFSQQKKENLIYIIKDYIAGMTDNYAKNILGTSDKFMI